MASAKGLFSKVLIREGWFDKTAQRVGWFDATLLDSSAAAGIDARVSWVQLELPAASAVSGTLKYWNGSAWVAKTLKYWTGAAWVAKPLKRWNGSSWI